MENRKIIKKQKNQLRNEKRIWLTHVDCPRPE